MRKLLFFTLLILSSMTVWGQAQIQMPLPNHGSTFSGNVRGYWFQAPTCFTITGLEVPTDANTGSQSIALMRFPTQPPSYSATTNTFDVLYLTQSNPASGIIPVNIRVQAGEYIGILGYRGTSNSYAGGTYSSNIAGFPVTLERLGMQYQLTTTAPQNVWTELGGSISRTFIYYDSTLGFNLTQSIAGLAVTFDNNADTSFTSVWDYGDGSPLDTTVGGPVTHNYAAGVYNACNYIYTACGIDTLCTTVVLCSVIPTASYTSASTGLSANFTDGSTNASSWWWDFGDGNTDTTQNPTHTYAASGWYTVCLTTTSSCGATDTLCDSVLVCLPPVAAYSSMQPSADSVMFTNASTDATSYLWDFGDGNTSTAMDPTHVYANSGTYTVCLTSTGFCGTDSSCTTVNICLDPVVTAFASTVSGADLTLADSSTGTNGQMWDFGDGNTSSMASPSHSYAANGTYTVCLTAWNNCGDTSTVCDTVVICAAPVAGFSSSIPGTNGVVDFTQTTSFPGTSMWDFGDGNTSTATDPQHTYANSGTYNVCLIADNGCGADTTCDSVTVIIVALDDQLSGTSVTWVPNPFTDRVELRIEGMQHPVMLTLTDLQGRVVMKREVTGNTSTILRDGLPSGTYLYQLKSADDKSFSGRLIAQ